MHSRIQTLLWWAAVIGLALAAQVNVKKMFLVGLNTILLWDNLFELKS